MKTLEKNSYVDDILISGDTLDETREIASLTKQILAEGQFNLGKFRSCPPELASSLGAEPTYDEYKILGIKYDPKTDEFAASADKINQFRNLLEITKRQAAGIVSRIYDPLGFVSPVSLQAKMLRQATDKDHPKADWNFKLSPSRTEEWH